MKKRKLTRARKRLGFAFLVVIILTAGAAPLLAWHPVIEAQPECLPDGTYEVSGHAAPWVWGNLDDRTNPDIQIRRDHYGGEPVASGEFVIVEVEGVKDVPGFSWTDSTKYPGDQPLELTYVAVAMADWGGTGEEPRGPDNLHRAQTTTVILPGDCASEVVPGKIIVKKVTNVETGAEFAFTASWLTEGGFKLSNGEKEESGDLLPGTYSVFEVAHPDWTSAAVCDDDSAPDAISLQDGETVICTFTNTQKVVTASPPPPPPPPPPPTLTVTPPPPILTATPPPTDDRPVAVLPQVITATTTTSTTVAQTSETLPFTGIADSLIGGVAVALLMFGGLVLVSIRRREQDAIVVADDWHSRLTFYTLKY